jgi:hypothetical protein
MKNIFPPIRALDVGIPTFALFVQIGPKRDGLGVVAHIHKESRRIIAVDRVVHGSRFDFWRRVPLTHSLAIRASDLTGYVRAAGYD